MNWEVVIRHYIANHRSRKDGELIWFSRQPSLESVIDLAAKAVDSRGKRYSHQRKIRRKSIEEARTILHSNAGRLRSARNFHDLWKLLDLLLSSVGGIGELYIYDTALRIGAFLKLAPEKVYLHAGVRKGARRSRIRSSSKLWIERSELPNALQGLPVDDVEDILCIYKDKLTITIGPNETFGM